MGGLSWTGTVNRGNNLLARLGENTDIDLVTIKKPLAATKRTAWTAAGGQAWSKGRRVIDCLAKVVSDAVS